MGGGMYDNKQAFGLFNDVWVERENLSIKSDWITSVVIFFICNYSWGRISLPPCELTRRKGTVDQYRSSSLA